MRLQLSTKAARQIKNAPPNDCGTHPKTVYRKVPDHLKGRLEKPYDYACDECLKVLEQQVAEEKAEARRREQEAEKDIRRQRQEALDRALHEQGKLASLYDQAVSWEEEHARRRAQADQGVERTTSDAAKVRRAVSEREQALLEARQRLAKTKADLSRAEEAVEAARAFREEVGDERPFAQATIQHALEAFDAAWEEAPRRRKRKKIDRALRKRVTKLLKRAAEDDG